MRSWTFILRMCSERVCMCVCVCLCVCLQGGHPAAFAYPHPEPEPPGPELAPDVEDPPQPPQPPPGWIHYPVYARGRGRGRHYWVGWGCGGRGRGGRGGRGVYLAPGEHPELDQAMLVGDVMQHAHNI